MKKIVIIGGLGYIGTELSRLYSGFSWEYEVVVIDKRFISRRVNELKNWKIKFIQGDILNINEIKNEIQNAHIVHHLAGITDVAYVQKDSNKIQDDLIKSTSIEGTQNILDSMNENAKIIFQNIYWVLPLTGILLFYGLCESLAKANFKIVFPTLVRNLIWRVSMSIGIVLIAFDYLEYDQLSQILVGCWLFSLICIAIYIFGQGDFKFEWKNGIHKLPEIKEFNSFSKYVILLSLGGILIQRIDQLMVTSYLGTSAAGVFSTAMYFATLIEIPKRSVMAIISPILVDSFKSHNIKKVDQLYFLGMKVH